MEENKMAKLTTAEFIEAIKELSVLELNDLVKACEEEFGVSAAAGVVVAAAAEGGADIFSSSRHSDFLICFRLGLVTGCFATKIVQQSSYGRMDVSYVSIFLRLIQYPACPWQ